MQFEQKTPTLLRMYFGLDQERSVKKAKVFDELVHRGVSVYAVAEAMDRLLFAVGWAADNRIPEVDDGN